MDVDANAGVDIIRFCVGCLTVSSSGGTLSLKMGKKESQLQYWASELIQKGIYGQELGLPSSPPGLLSLEHEMARTVCPSRIGTGAAPWSLKQCSVHDLDVFCIDLAPKYLISPSENHLPLKLTPPL